MKSDRQKNLRQRLNRISGQVEGLGKMIDNERYCIDILTQVSAIRSALDALAINVLCEHVEHCLDGSGHPNAHGKRRSALADEIRTSLNRMVR